MNGIIVTIFLCCVVFGIELVNAGNWTDWVSVTECTAKPCKCNNKRKEKCKRGSRIQIRGCVVGKDGSPCLYNREGTGPIREDKRCINKGKCPGWSDWSEWSECRYDGSAGTKRTKERICNNPSPIHKDVLCILENTDSGTHEYVDEHGCKIEAEQTTEVPEVTTEVTTAPLPCCSSTTTSAMTTGFTDYSTDDFTMPGISEFPTTTEADAATMSVLDAAYDDEYNLLTRTCDDEC